MLQFLRRLAGLTDAPAWHENITDPWFRDHFVHAAPLVCDWLSGMDLKTASLLDFGCGDGITDLGVALKGRPKKLVGIDVTSSFTRLNELARREIGLKRLPKNLSFRSISPGQKLDSGFDAIFSWSTFEHVERELLPTILSDLYSMLPAGGLFFLQIEPLYYSPFGSHLGRFVKEPWAHLLWDEETLKRRVLDHEDDIPANEKEYNFFVRSFSEYKAFIYNEYRKLNRLTANELKRFLEAAGFETVREERGRVELTPPEELSARHDKEDLMTNEIRLLLRKPR